MSGSGHPARFWRREADGAARCELCPHCCRIPPGRSGRCGPRRNEGGALVAGSYGQVSALALDPIEKKPLRRFHPGAAILSVGSWGCNMRCPFCQNHDISMARPDTRALPPERLAAMSRELTGRGNLGVAYTYNEPLVGVEYLLDCARLVREGGQYNVVVTNGQIEEAPLRELLPLVDAWNIDLKDIDPAGYRGLGGELEAARRCIRLAAACAHVEVTALILSGRNRGEEAMRRLSGWLAGVNPAIPLHVARAFPRYRSHAPPTPVGTVYRLAEVAREQLAFVYEGNC